MTSFDFSPSEEECLPREMGRLPISRQQTYLHGFQQTWQWLEAAGAVSQQRFVARLVSHLVVGSSLNDYQRGQLDAITEWSQKEAKASSSP